MNKFQKIKIQSLLKIKKEKLWKDIWNFENINKELAPFARMTPPNISLDEIDVNSIPLNQKLFESYVFLFWIIPVDIHHFKIKSITEFVSFEETSTTLLLKQWNHTRKLESRNEQTLLTDIITFQHKISFLGKLTLPVYKKIFQHRHKHLRTKYNNYFPKNYLPSQS